MIESLFQAILISPFVWVLILGFLFFTNINLPEKFLSQSVKWFSLYMVSLSLVLFVIVWSLSPKVHLLDYKDWFKVGEYDFKVRIIIDLLGATYALLSSALIGIIFRFSSNYLHKEEGYFRFIFLLSIMLFGLLVVCFARSLDLLFAGWELVGTTSVLLICYFYNQIQPVKHSLKAIISYRLCDMGILAAAAWAHHELHSTDFTQLDGLLARAHGHEFALVMIGLFVIWASLAKAGQLPMCSWLPTAMEGPTPSSAIFYGALSVHLGPFLLIRFHDYFREIPGLLWVIGIIGGLSALYASMVGRTRSDAKTMLGYATISQVGLIYIEIALGYTNFALFHIVAHASLRTWQFLRSSSIIHDFFDNPMVRQNTSIQRQMSWERLFSNKLRKKIFIHALHGFHLDYFTKRVIDLICFPAKVFIRIEAWMMKQDEKLLSLLVKKGDK